LTKILNYNENLQDILLEFSAAIFIFNFANPENSKYKIEYGIN
jgi:hypothetical protein